LFQLDDHFVTAKLQPKYVVSVTVVLQFYDRCPRAGTQLRQWETPDPFATGSGCPVTMRSGGNRQMNVEPLPGWL